MRRRFLAAAALLPVLAWAQAPDPSARIEDAKWKKFYAQIVLGNAR